MAPLPTFKRPARTKRARKPVSWLRYLGAAFFVVGFNLSSYVLYKEYQARVDAARSAPAPRADRPPARNGVITAFAGVDDAWELSPWRRKAGEDPGAGGAFHARVAAPDGGWRDAAEAARAAAREAAVRLRASTRDVIADADRERWADAEFVSGAPGADAPPWEAPGAGAGAGGAPETWEADARPLVLVVCYNRPRYLAETLRGLSRAAGLQRVAVAVSQDGSDALVAGVADAFGGIAADAEGGQELGELDAAALAALLQPDDARALAPPKTARFARWRHARADRMPLRSGAPPRPTPGHVALAAHYGWALTRAFGSEGGASHVIILEDDMLVSRDFLTFFAAAAPLLRADPTLWCASSWNDNGAKALLSDAASLRRTGFFPGLGWMLAAPLWDELAPQWPAGNWDHWMRSDDVARGRECVVPQVPRNLNIGRRGANMQAWLFDRRLSRMGFAGGSGMATFGDLGYLRSEAWEERLRAAVAAPSVEWRDLTRAQLAKAARKAAAAADMHPPAALLLYTSEEYEHLAKLFEIWPTPRGGSRGVTFLRDGDVAYVLADARGCELLPESLRLRPQPGLTHVAAARGATCNATCAAAGGACDGAQFWWVNRCAALRAAFACERGCALAVGPDVPAYNDDDKSVVFQQCLVTETRSRCDARHYATRRLCPCVPRPGGGPVRAAPQR